MEEELMMVGINNNEVDDEMVEMNEDRVEGQGQVEVAVEVEVAELPPPLPLSAPPIVQADAFNFIVPPEDRLEIGVVNSNSNANQNQNQNDSQNQDHHNLPGPSGVAPASSSNSNNPSNNIEGNVEEVGMVAEVISPRDRRVQFNIIEIESNNLSNRRSPSRPGFRVSSPPTLSGPRRIIELVNRSTTTTSTSSIRRCTRSSGSVSSVADSPRKKRRCSNIGNGNSHSGHGHGSNSTSGTRRSTSNSNSNSASGRNSENFGNSGTSGNPGNSRMNSSGMSWQETMSSMSERIRHSFNKPEMSDITFVVGQDMTEVYAHKTLLCFCSPVFQAQFYGPMSSQKDTEEIPDIQADVFINFLSFLYCETFDDEMDVKQLLDLLYPAKKYLVPSLSERCVNELIEKLKPENIFSVFEVADLFDEVQLKKQCIKYMERMSDKIVETEEFKNIDVRTLSVFLALDGLNSPECHLHRGLLGWAEAECIRQEQIKTKETIRTILGPAMYMIRFPTMSAAEFSKEFPDSVLTDEESLVIYRQICSNPTWQPEISYFSTHKREFSPTIYCVNRFETETKEPHQLNFRDGALYNLDIDFVTNKRIYMNGVSLFAVERTHAGSNVNLGFDINLRVFKTTSRTFPEQPVECRTRHLRVEGDLTSRVVACSRSKPHYFQVFFDKPLEIPAWQKVIVHVTLTKSDPTQTNLNTFYGTTGGFHMPPDYKIYADCEDGRTVLFTFGNKVNTELGVYSFGQIPEILFSL